jgi:PKD repeat protein
MKPNENNTNYKSFRPKNRPKYILTPPKKFIVFGFALYLTFILLTIVPFIAQTGVRTVTENMDTKYDYHLTFPEDGENTHYYVIREDKAEDGEITLTYTTPTHTLDVEVKNIINLVIDCESIYYDESMDVYKEDPFSNINLYFDYFTEEHDEFTINVKTDTAIEELRFKDAPEPVEVFVDGEEWWKDGEGLYYEFEGNDIVLTSVEEGNTQVILYFKLKLPPRAIFTIEETNTETVGKKIYGFINQEITFDGSDSHDNLDDGTITEYDWSFGDDNHANEDIVSHTYDETGTYTVELEVTDDNGLTGNSTKEIIIVETSTDKDMDGMDDTWEKTYGFNLDKDDSLEDADFDQLTNIDEHKYGTNPLAKDSDGDQYTDYDEILVHETDPTDITDKPTQKKADGDDEGDGMLFALVGIAVVIVIIIIIVLLMLLKKRKGEAEGEVEGEKKPEDKEEVEGAAGAEGEVVKKMPKEGETPPEPGAPGEPPSQLPEQPTESGEPTIPVKGPPGQDQDGIMPPPDLGAEEMDLEGGMEMEEPFSASAEEGVPPDELGTEMEDMKMTEGELPPPPPDSEMTLDIDASGLGLGAIGAGEEPDAMAMESAIEEEPGTELEEGEGEDQEEEGELTVKDHVKKGALFFKDGQYSEAIIEWQKALDIEPDHPEIVESIKEAMAKMKEQ